MLSLDLAPAATLVNVRGLYLRDPQVYEFPYPVVDQPLREWAAKLIDQFRPGHTFRNPTYKTYYLTAQDDAARLAKYLETEVQWPQGFDFETRGWSPKAKLAGVLGGAKIHRGLSPLHPKWRAVPITFQIFWGTDAFVVRGEYLYLFTKWLEEVAQLDLANASFESHVCKNQGINLSRFYRDVIHMDFNLEETRHQDRHGLKDCMRYYLGLEPKSYDKVFKVDEYETLLSKDPHTALEYAALDPIGTTFAADVVQVLLSQRKARDGYDGYELYQRYERPFQSSHIRMEQTGAPLSVKAIKAHHAKMTEEIGVIDGKALKLVGKKINLSSNKALGGYYYGQKKNPVILTTGGYTCLLCNKTVNKRTNNECKIHGKGALVNTPSVDDIVLERMAKEGEPLSSLLQQRRTVDKARGTWVDGYYKYSSGEPNGYPSINGSNVVSGRFSGGVWLTTPEYLRDVLGYDEEGDEVILGADYAQLELRVLTHASQDPMMLDAFLNNRDLHGWTGALIELFQTKGIDALSDKAAAVALYNEIVEATKVSDTPGAKLTTRQKHLLKQRKAGKVCNFAIAYGVGPEKLANDIGCTKHEAEMISKAVWATYGGLKKFYDELLKTTRQTLEMRTLIGRNRVIVELQSTRQGVRGHGERLVSNTPAQTGAADILRGAMIQVDIDLEAGGAYGTVGRGAYGSWVNGVWRPDYTVLPKAWGVSGLPPALADGLGSLGKWGYRMWLQCHDELLFRGPKKHVEQAKERVKAIMSDPFGEDLKMNCPLGAKVGWGYSWASVK